MIDPYGLHVTSDNVEGGVRTDWVRQPPKDASITWQDQMGGGAVTRLQGAKEAIKAIMNDSSLTSGANFGYGHWNSGRGWRNKWHEFGQHTCHFTTKGVPRAKVKNGNDNCPYWDGWDGSHPDGHSTLCNKDSCINVGVSANGFTQIPDAVDATRMAWGTDANAFSRMAYGYYTDASLDIIDEESTCQLNYVIVISDGAWTHDDIAEPLIESLRTDYKVKTLVVAYGGGVDRSLARYERMARAGSCAVAGSAECKPYIKADTPQELKTHLQSAIQQIIADMLSFTAPSITATIQEGGSLYQAQFNYQQYGEWQGTILRKAIDTNANVIHDPNHEGNWDAAEELKLQPSRNIWTVLPTAPYKGNWDNWKTGNSSEISALFDVLQNRVLDYHNASSTCSNATGVANGISDDIDGLINFIRGQDYFD
jgi:type IV pilus assembly protein PilY1